MCGLAGIASRKAVAQRRWLSSTLAVLRHRGPDGEGEWWDETGRVGLAHRRLAVVDLSSAAQQPMHDTREGLSLVFNGEIYNYVELRALLAAEGFMFRTESDTEVILAAYRKWGVDCCTHFIGMFAFALYDRAREQLFLARDRAGEKPLFYAEQNSEMRFASEMKALFADTEFPRRIDPESLDCYLSMGFVPGRRSMLYGVNKLPPAHSLLFDLTTGKSRVWRYWDVPAYEPAQYPLHESELLNELEAHLEVSVRGQLSADVPVGVLLSGGVDSSLVTALAARTKSSIKTFTVRFPGSGKYDETEHARLIAHHFATDHVELEAEPSTVDLLPALARQIDEPINDSSIIPTYLVTRLVRQHCTVALGGDGGDELFGGYRHYSRLLWLERRFGGMPLAFRRIIADAAQALPLGFKGRSWLQALGTDFRRSVPLIACYFDSWSRKKLLGKSCAEIVNAETVYVQGMPVAPDLLQRATRLDFQNYLPEDILVKVDRTSMLNSLEVRAPFLDRRVIDFAFRRVPSSLKVTPTGRKLLLQKLAVRLLPPTFDSKRKQGFSIPISSWLANDHWRSFFREVLLDSQQTLFSHRALEELFDGQTRGRANGERLFGLLMFELWRREYRVHL